MSDRVVGATSHPTPGSIVVPPLPPLPPDTAAEHGRLHGLLADRWRGASTPAAAVLSYLARRVLVEALANVRPTWIDPLRPRLVPPPRGFLDENLLTRRRGAAEALRYLQARLAMVRMGSLRHVVDHGVPEVLNVLLQAAPRSGSARDETNPGLVRATPTWWMPDANPFVHPSPDRCAPLLASATEFVMRAPAPAIARAGWLGFMVNTIHPFVDGNGRTVRALALALASAGPSGTDHGMLEQWTLDRDAYVGALQAGQRGREYSATTVDPRPFMRFTVATSTRGAELTLARLTFVEKLVEELRRRGASDQATRALAIVLVDRFVRLDDLVASLTSGSHAVADVESRDDRRDVAAQLDAHELVVALVRSGALLWADSPPGRPSARGLAPGPPVADLAEACVDAVAVFPDRPWSDVAGS